MELYFILIFITKLVMKTSSETTKADAQSEKQVPMVLLSPRNNYEDYVIYDTTKPLGIQCTGLNLPPTTSLFWYHYTIDPNKQTGFETQLPSISGVRMFKANNTLKLNKIFPKSANFSQIYCLGTTYNTTTRRTVARSKNLTLVLNGSNLTNIDNYFRNLLMNKPKIPIIKLPQITGHSLPIDYADGDRVADSSKFMVIGATIGLLVIMILLSALVYTRHRLRKLRNTITSSAQESNHEEPEYATIPDVVHYAQLQLPLQSRELPNIPHSETPYTKIVGKLVPKKHDGDTSYEY